MPAIPAGSHMGRNHRPEQWHIPGGARTPEFLQGTRTLLQGTWNSLQGNGLCVNYKDSSGALGSSQGSAGTEGSIMFSI